VFNVVEFDKEGYAPVFAKVEVCLFGTYGETAAERPYAGVGIGNLIFTHFCHVRKDIIIFGEFVISACIGLQKSEKCLEVVAARRNF
jgi:hypothetical protein